MSSEKKVLDKLAVGITVLGDITCGEQVRRLSIYSRQGVLPRLSALGCAGMVKPVLSPVTQQQLESLADPFARNLLASSAT